MARKFTRINDLQDGMIVRNVGGGKNFVVQGVYGDHAIGVATVDISNPREWEIVYDPSERKAAS